MKKYIVCFVCFILFMGVVSCAHGVGVSEEDLNNARNRNMQSVHTQREAPVMDEGGRYVYLTFDDGPSPNTSLILDLLSEYQIQGTFFLLGSSIEEYEDSAAVIQRILDEGHYIGLHSMTHNMQHLYRVRNAHINFYNEMVELQELINELTGGFETYLYRAPYGTRDMFTRDHIRTMIDSDFNCWDWHVDTEDWRLRSVDDIMRKIRTDMESNLNPEKAVVLFHERDITLRALPRVIEYYQNLGYTFMSYHPDNHFRINIIVNSDL